MGIILHGYITALYKIVLIPDVTALQALKKKKGGKGRGEKGEKKEKKRKKREKRIWPQTLDQRMQTEPGILLRAL